MTGALGGSCQSAACSLLWVALGHQMWCRQLLESRLEFTLHFWGQGIKQYKLHLGTLSVMPPAPINISNRLETRCKLHLGTLSVTTPSPINISNRLENTIQSTPWDSLCDESAPINISNRLEHIIQVAPWDSFCDDSGAHT